LRKQVPVALCTGRMFSGTREIAAGLKLLGPVACIDGSHIFDLHTRGELSCTAISTEAAHFVREALSMYRPAAFVFSGDRVIHDSRGDRFLNYLSTWSDVRHRVVDVHHPTAWELSPSVAALVLMGDEETILGMDRALDGVPGLQHIVFDVPMLKRAGQSFAMAQAPAEVKAAAKHVLRADIWLGGGVAEAAELAGLI
jgi:hydroxymethylpyrimidine pyrophosphatase-like HAD family hydrolase